MVRDAAGELCGGRLLIALEGGYHLVALPWCVRRTLELLLGDEPTRDPLGLAGTREPDVDAMLREVKSLHGLA
jgi:acetoin utilization deacetylase AcuC-like enzyme